MKITTLIILVASLQVSAKGYSQKISLNLKNSAVQQIFKEIEKQSGYSFIYAKEQADKFQAKDFRIENVELATALNLLLKDTKFTYNFSGKNIVLTEKSITSLDNLSTLLAVPFTVTGKVLTEEGKPIEGVTVRIKNSTKGTSTKMDGSFSIEIPSSSSFLVFSYVGMESVEVKVSNATTLKITLKDKVSMLEDFVLIGYQSVKKSDLTGAVSQLKSDGVVEKPVTSVEQLIQGRVSGVQVQSANGAPGGGLSIVIRGGNSTSSNQPLYVIDGYPVDAGNGDLQTGGNNQAVATPPANPMANLNPNEIESIEILKDASSTAIYGSRGANGVVLITTKRGKKGTDKLEFNYRTDVFNIRKKLNVLGSVDFLSYANEAAVNGGVAKPYDSLSIVNLSQISHNWQDEIFQQGITHDYQLGLSGGEGKTNYSIIGNYTNSDGIIKNSDFSRGGIRVNFDREISSKFKIGVNVNGSKSTTHLGVNGISTGLTSSNVIASALYSLPFINPLNSGGNIDQSIDANPYTLINLLKDVYSNTVFFSNMTATYQVDKYLSLKSNMGGNFSQSLRQTYYPKGTYVGTQSNGYAYQNQDSRFNYLGEFTLNYKRSFKDNNINAVLGHTYQKWNLDGLAASASNFPNDNLGYYSFQMAQSYGQTVTAHQEWSLASFLGRINYGFKDRYLLTLTGRSDGASRLAPGHKWAFFPSAAIGWNINNEPFMKSVNWVNTLKLRASYGLSGNQSVAIGSTEQFLTNDAAVIGGAISRGYILNNIANPLLGWENTRQVNIGTEIGVFNNRINVEINLYKKNTDNLLITLPITTVSGFSSLTTNAGQVENKGIEFDLKARILQKKFKWTFGGNLSINRNKMTDMGPLGKDGAIFGPSYLSSGSLLSQPIHITSLGNPIGSFYGYKINGIYQNATDVANGPEKNTAKPGDFKFVDINGDGIITAADRTIIGNPNPNFIFGVNNDFEYKGLTLSIFVQGSIGNQIANLNRYRSDALTGNIYNISQSAYNGRWTGEGTSNYYPRARWTGGYFNSRFSDFIIEDGSYIRLKNLTLGYNIPLGKLKVIKNARLFVTASNLVTITKYSGYDPEVNTNYNNPLTPGVDNGTYPQVKTFSTGINLKF
jgi:TonB-linked SusC/RagA family outer membrane protein